MIGYCIKNFIFVFFSRPEDPELANSSEIGLREHFAPRGTEPLLGECALASRRLSDLLRSIYRSRTLVRSEEGTRIFLRQSCRNLPLSFLVVLVSHFARANRSTFKEEIYALK